MTEANTGTAATVADIVRQYITPTQIALVHPKDGTEAPVIVIPDGNGLRIVPVNLLFDAYRDHPERREGTATLGDLDSFIAHANRFRDISSVIFADSEKSGPSLRAVFDYHEAVNDPDDGEPCDELARPRFGVHQSIYRFPLADEWLAWNASNRQPMTQSDFSAFIEERALDILPAPTFQGELSGADRKLMELSGLLHGKFAGPEKMIELSRGLSVFESSKVISATRITSGECSIIFESEHHGSDGKKLDVPNLFCIGIPVFGGGDAYRVVVRLRYRKQGSAISWHYDLYRQDAVFRDAFRGACAAATNGTGLPLYVGSPES